MLIFQGDKSALEMAPLAIDMRKWHIAKKILATLLHLRSIIVVVSKSLVS